MAVEMTFNSLRQDLQRYLERGQSLSVDPLVFDQIPALINLAERSIATKLKLLGFLRAVNGTLAQGVGTVVKPTRWRRTVSMSITLPGGTGTERAVLFPRSYEYLRTFAPDASVRGRPQFYAEYDFDNWLIAPVPDVNYAVEILYYEQPPLLDETTQTNWLTAHAPNALLYGALLEATPFLKEDERIPVWQAMYDRELGALDSEDIQRAIDRTSKRDEA